MDAGYSTEMYADSVQKFKYPNGQKWSELFASGKYKDPSLAKKVFKVE